MTKDEFDIIMGDGYNSPYTDLTYKDVKLDGWFTVEQLYAVIARHNTLHGDRKENATANNNN